LTHPSLFAQFLRVFRAESDASASNSHEDSAFDWASAAKPRAGSGGPAVSCTLVVLGTTRDPAFLSEPGQGVSGRPRRVRSGRRLSDVTAPANLLGLIDVVMVDGLPEMAGGGEKGEGRREKGKG